MWKRVVGYGAMLATGTLALQWLDYQRLARMHLDGIYLFLVAAAFLVLGVILGVRVFAAPAPVTFDGNPKAQAALGLPLVAWVSKNLRHACAQQPSSVMPLANSAL